MDRAFQRIRSLMLRGTFYSVPPKYFINYIPGGPTDPNYVLVRFIGSEATIWINQEFARITI